MQPYSHPIDDVFTLLDELRAIAHSGLAYAESPFDRERYERILVLVSREYATRVDLPAEEVRARFARELGYATAKVGVDAAVIDDDGRLLVILRTDDGCWALPGGWVDPNELPEDALVRELSEELGVVGAAGPLVGAFGRPASAQHGWHAAVALVYLATIASTDFRPAAHEVAEIAWKHVDDIRPWHQEHEKYARAAVAAQRARQPDA